MSSLSASVSRSGDTFRVILACPDNLRVDLLSAEVASCRVGDDRLAWYPLERAINEALLAAEFPMVGDLVFVRVHFVSRHAQFAFQVSHLVEYEVTTSFDPVWLDVIC